METILISLSALLISVFNIYLSHFRSPKVYGKIKGLYFYPSEEINLPIDLKESYKQFIGYGYCILLNIISTNSNFQIKNIKVEVKESNEIEFKKAIPFSIVQEEKNRFEYSCLNTISVLSKDVSNDLILQFLIEGEKKKSVRDNELKTVKITLENYQKNKQVLILNLDDLDLKNLNPAFVKH